MFSISYTFIPKYFYFAIKVLYYWYFVNNTTRQNTFFVYIFLLGVIIIIILFGNSISTFNLNSCEQHYFTNTLEICM